MGILDKNPGLFFNGNKKKKHFFEKLEDIPLKSAKHYTKTDSQKISDLNKEFENDVEGETSVTHKDISASVKKMYEKEAFKKKFIDCPVFFGAISNNLKKIRIIFSSISIIL